MKIWLLLSGLVFLAACQQQPKTLGVTDSGVLIEKNYQKVILANAIVFDTRSPFDFNTSKIPNSINLPVSDFDSSKDKLDSARRLSLYGVTPSSSIVIVGDGKGDEQKLAWQFIKLGVTKIETLKVNVFRLMNLRSEPARQNAIIWKPETSFDEINLKAFHKKMETLRPKPVSRARVEALQSSAAAQALIRRVLVIASHDEWKKIDQYMFADHFEFNDEALFDEKGLLNRSQIQNQKFGNQLKKYDVVFLVDSSPRKYLRAYALVQFGAPNLQLVH